MRYLNHIGGGPLTPDQEEYYDRLKNCFNMPYEVIINNKEETDYFINKFREKVIKFIENNYDSNFLRETNFNGHDRKSLSLKVQEKKKTDKKYGSKEIMIAQIEKFYDESYGSNDDPNVNLLGKLNIFCLQCIIFLTFEPHRGGYPPPNPDYMIIHKELTKDDNWLSYQTIVEKLRNLSEVYPFINTFLNKTEPQKIEDAFESGGSLYTGIYFIICEAIIPIDILNEACVKNFFICGTSFSSIEVHEVKGSPIYFLLHDLTHMYVFQESCYYRNDLTPLVLKNFYEYFNEKIKDLYSDPIEQKYVLDSVNLIFFCIIHETNGGGSCFFLFDNENINNIPKWLNFFFKKDPLIDIFIGNSNNPLEDVYKICYTNDNINFSPICGITFLYIVTSIIFYFDFYKGFFKSNEEPNEDPKKLTEEAVFENEIFIQACLLIKSLLIDGKSEILIYHIDKFKNLDALGILRTSLTTLPDSIGELTKLTELVINENDNLTSLPGNLKDKKFDFSNFKKNPRLIIGGSSRSTRSKRSKRSNRSTRSKRN